MVYFNLKKTTIFRRVLWDKALNFDFANILKKLSSALFLFTFFFFSYGFLSNSFSLYLNRKLLGLSLLFFSLNLICKLNYYFLDLKFKKPKIKTTIKQLIANPKKLNVAEVLDFKAAKIIYKTIKFAKANPDILFKKEEKGAEAKKETIKINSTILFCFLLKEIEKLDFIFSRLLLDLNKTKKILKEELKSFKGKKWVPEFSKDFQDTILDALKIAEKKHHLRIEGRDLLSALAKNNEVFQKILIEARLKAEDVTNICWWVEDLEKRKKEKERFWEYKNLAKSGSIASDWASGYTSTLDKFSTDWSDIVKAKGFREIVGMKKEMSAMERILSRNEINNVLLVGKPGQGRMKLIQELARKSLSGLSTAQVNLKRVISLDVASILSIAESREKAEMILDEIFKEVVFCKNVILVIDDFHNYIGQETRPGVINLSGVISSYLSLPSFQMIAITNYSGLHKFIEPDTSILGLFEKVEISEISEIDTMRVLENQIPFLEEKYKIFVSYPAIRDIIKYTAKYMASVPFPKKAIDLLDEAIVYAANFTKSKFLLPSHIARIMSDKTQIPIGEIEDKEKKILLNMEDLIHQRIINQNEAVKELSSALRRARTGVAIKKGPIGTFLFLGPTGVGKTETAKSLAEIYFNSEDRMIRLDMSEFQSVSDIARLIGSSKEEGLLTTKVKEDPFSLILLDEIEKAHPNILNLFLQVLDEGTLTDGLGRSVDFKNTIIIATSNAGYLMILEAIKEKKEMKEIKGKLLDSLFERAIFRPEFINRFDAVVLFKALSKENLLDISHLLLKKLKKNLRKKDINFIITEGIKEKVVELGYNPKFGARELNRVIQDKLGNVLAKALLNNQIKQGDKIEIDPETFEIKINS